MYFIEMGVFHHASSTFRKSRRCEEKSNRNFRYIFVPDQRTGVWTLRGKGSDGDGRTHTHTHSVDSEFGRPEMCVDECDFNCFRSVRFSMFQQRPHKNIIKIIISRWLDDAWREHPGL